MHLQEDRIVLRYPRRAPELDGIYYHISECDHGSKFEMHPRIPYSSFTGEPDIKRICVSPTVFQCICAVPNRFRENNKLYIYRTKAEAYFPFDVWDREITEEIWILNSTIFKKCFIIDKGKFDEENIKLINDYCLHMDQLYDYCSFKRVRIQLKNLIDQLGIPDRP